MKNLKIATVTTNGKKDYLTETILVGLKELGHHVIVSDIGNSIHSSVSDADFIEAARNADCILAFFGKVRGNLPPKYYLLDKINRWDVTAYIDGSEWTATGNPNQNQVQLSKSNSAFRRGEPWIEKSFLQKCKFYFKREAYEQDINIGVIPLPFAALNSSKYIEQEKKYDIFCSFGQTNDGLRSDVECFLKNWKTDYSINLSKNLSYDDFLKITAQSKIAIDAWGGGDCCARFWEIAINKTCLAYQKYNIRIPNPYTDMENCIEYSSIKELHEKLEIVLADEKLLNKITNSCYEHTINFHTTSARANYMLQKMGF